ncbi:hypothetical protein GQ600_13594 [Phytophthora cactorum]|nr:hypothetical protein GQ600_13594 [Phytophthora cactorum]
MKVIAETKKEPSIEATSAAEKPEVDDTAVEIEVCTNIAVPLEVEGLAATVTVDMPSPVHPSRRVIRGETMRGIAREAVYRMLKEDKDGSTKMEGDTKGPETGGVPPLRGKVPKLNLERLWQFADSVTVKRELLKDLWMFWGAG